MEVILSCYKCGRGYHLDCSGIQHEWAGFKALECSHYGLSCCSKKQWTPTKEFAKKENKRDSERPPSSKQIIRENSSQPLLPWVVVEREDDARRKRFKWIDENVAGIDVGMTKKQETSPPIFEGDKKNSVVARSSVVKPNHAERVTEEFLLRSDTTIPIITENLVALCN